MLYEELKAKIDESIRKEERRQYILRKKREEKAAIKKAGGGHKLAKAIMPYQGSNEYDTDFNYGANVSHESPRDDDRCMGPVKCERCKKFHGYCAEIGEKMLPTGDGNESRSNRARTGGLNFINATDLSTTPSEAKILMVKLSEKPGKGPAITIKLAFKGEIRYLWTPCRKTDARYAALLGAFGPDENNWVDERIHLSLEKDDFTENYQVTINIPERAEKKGKK